MVGDDGFDNLRIAPSVDLNVPACADICVGDRGIEPRASRTRTERSTDELVSVVEKNDTG